MSVCEHDPYCKGSGPDHDAGVRRDFAPVESAEEEVLPPLAALIAARPILRKDARSGDPAKKARALQRLMAVEHMIADARRAESKS